MQGSDLVVPLDVQPVVVNGRSGDQRERNLELGTSWFQHHDEWAAMPADDGPDEWQRIDVTVDQERRELNDDGEKTRVDIVVPAAPIEPVALPEAVVSNVEINEQSLSFDVDRTGVPVLVKVSYFPNWEADGAEGPYRIGANMMVVVPTSNHVELNYGRTGVDYLTMLLSLLGVVLCFVWRRQGDVVHASETPVIWSRQSAFPDLVTADHDGELEPDPLAYRAESDPPDPVSTQGADSPWMDRTRSEPGEPAG